MQQYHYHSEDEFENDELGALASSLYRSFDDDDKLPNRSHVPPNPNSALPNSIDMSPYARRLRTQSAPMSSLNPTSIHPPHLLQHQQPTPHLVSTTSGQSQVPTISTTLPPRLAGSKPSNPLPPYKTVVCRAYMATGKCFRAQPEKCWFAHGLGELRDALEEGKEARGGGVGPGGGVGRGYSGGPSSAPLEGQGGFGGMVTGGHSVAMPPVNVMNAGGAGCAIGASNLNQGNLNASLTSLFDTFMASVLNNTGSSPAEAVSQANQLLAARLKMQQQQQQQAPESPMQLKHHNWAGQQPPLRIRTETFGSATTSGSGTWVQERTPTSATDPSGPPSISSLGDLESLISHLVISSPNTATSKPQTPVSPVALCQNSNYLFAGLQQQGGSSQQTQEHGQIHHSGVSNGTSHSARVDPRNLAYLKLSFVASMSQVALVALGMRALLPMDATT
ncbi:hypothetical protein HDV05_005362 [Chytridiales sp. JEL 0842]|nr:hypothetical protein HDV05_005362 [Chytridiales sp. JEL 0842]